MFKTNFVEMFVKWGDVKDSHEGICAFIESLMLGLRHELGGYIFGKIAVHLVVCDESSIGISYARPMKKMSVSITTEEDDFIGVIHG